MMLPHRALRLPALPIAALIGASLLGACSNPEKTGRFLIDPPVAGVQVPNRLGTAELKDVSLPEYAADQEVAFQTGDGAVRSNSDNLWADDPARSFTTTLARAISDVSGATVISEPWPLAQPPPASWRCASNAPWRRPTPPIACRGGISCPTTGCRGAARTTRAALTSAFR